MQYPSSFIKLITLIKKVHAFSYNVFYASTNAVVNKFQALQLQTP